VKLFYMNQGGGGNWGAIKYKDYSVIMLAESDVVKDGFTLAWDSKKDSVPVMSIQTASGRIIATPKDLDTTAQHVRPLVTFTINGGDAVRVVFMHLKSADAAAATLALNAAVDIVLANQFGKAEKVIWIGDFNRAKPDHLKATFGDIQTLVLAGGQAAWDLDCAYATGDWKGYTLAAAVVSIAGDNAHAGLAVEYTKA